MRLTLTASTDTIERQQTNGYLTEIVGKGEFFMMYMHYCKRCQRVHMLNGHKQFCPKCQGLITELKLSYLDYVSMDESQRVSFTVCCADDEQLRKLSTTYRMYKYSKWYKELQRQLAQPTVHTFAVPEQSPLEDAVSIV